MDGESEKAANQSVDGGRCWCAYKYICMQKTGANENAVRARKEEGESKHMENRLGYLRKQMAVWVGLGLWLRGGLVLACSLLECSNPFHRAEDGPRQFSTQIGQFLDMKLYGIKVK